MRHDSTNLNANPDSSAAQNGRDRRRITLIAGAAYGLIIAFVWGIFAFSSGMPYETAFPYMSETSRGGHGFLYEADPLRIYMNVFYHVSYVLGDLLGATGSFAPYQFVYAALWWARGMLVFLIVRQLVPRSVVLPFIVGALTLTHAADGSLQWIGQMNQFGFIFWMLFAIYMLLTALQQTGVLRTAIGLFLACCFQYLCLWSYESPLFILLAAPIILSFFIDFKPLRRLLVLCAAWYVVPIWYMYMSYLRYSLLAGQTYQASVLRGSWSTRGLLSDLIFNVQYSLSFWSWHPTESHIGTLQTLMLSSAAVMTFLVAGAILVRLRYTAQSKQEAMVKGYAWRLLIAGLMFLILSFPAYLLLASSRMTWRTQLLSGPGAAIVLGAVISFATLLIPKARFRDASIIILAAPLIWLGSKTSIERGGYHRWVWHRHQRAMQGVLRAAPRLRDGTVVVLTGVPRAADPFGDDYWFDIALRLAFPRTRVAGVYYYEDGTANAGDNLELRADGWKWDGRSFVSLIRSADVDQTVVLQHGTDGTAKLSRSIPSFLCKGPCPAQGGYHPDSRIEDGAPSPEALRRYGPL
jgi:hypothetical protein